MPEQSPSPSEFKDSCGASKEVAATAARSTDFKGADKLKDDAV